jgi:prepilin-type N-terminal cleavage/methylation domain-containing protein
MASVKKNNVISSGSSGFTLIELSIVLVIIGLLVGGVMTGQNLIKQAKFRAVINEQNTVQEAINTFRIQYNAFPGDFNQGYSYWSTNCADTANKCNGNGDRKITITGADPEELEGYRFWQHLNLAGMYPGAYTGVGNGTGTSAIAGTVNVNIPASKMKGMGLTVIYESPELPQTTSGTHSGNLLIFGGQVVNSIANGTDFTAADAYQMDVKADDGSPLVGHILSIGTAGNAEDNCVDNTQEPAAYNLDAIDPAPCGIAVVF